MKPKAKTSKRTPKILTVAVWRSGKIKLTTAPQRAHAKGAILICSGPAHVVRKQVECKCRWAYDNKTMLCPGLPEAASEDAAMRALMFFRTWLREGIEKRIGKHKPAVK